MVNDPALTHMSNASTDTPLRVDDLCVAYRGNRAIDDVTFTLKRGEILGVIGADGAGKTSLLRAVVGLVKPAAGEVVLDKDVRLGYVSQPFSLYGDMSIQENISFFGALYGLTKQELKQRGDELLEWTGLAPFRDRLAQALSGGMKQKLSIAVSLLHRPSLLVLDELTNGVDPLARRELLKLIQKVAKDGVSVLYATQYLDEAERCDRVLLLHEGQTVQYGSPRELYARYPFRVWVVPESGHLRRALANGLRGQDGIANTYSRGSDTVLIVDDERAAAQVLQQWQRQQREHREQQAHGHDFDFAWEERAPRMEDVFIAAVKAAGYSGEKVDKEVAKGGSLKHDKEGGTKGGDRC